MLYELRKGRRVIERVRPRPGGFEETRLGVMTSERRGADGWHQIDEQGQPAETADADGG